MKKRARSSNRCTMKEYLTVLHSSVPGKDMLDIGCNVGHIAMMVAKTFQPKSVIGMDIDKSLVEIAKKNVRHYASCDTPKGKRQLFVCNKKKIDPSFPISYRVHE